MSTEGANAFRMRALQSPAVFEILHGGAEFRCGVFLQKADTLSRDRPIQERQFLTRPVGHLDADGPTIRLFPNAPGIAGTLDAIKRRRHCAACQAGRVRQRAGRHGTGLRQHAETSEIGAIESQPVRHGLIDLVRRVLEGLNPSADGGQKFRLQIV